ncbi:hypothetical protein CKA34_10405 [Rhizobium sp. 11515TR]|nr:hypothetical protein CKA34_10405 [Rhizobium sp. 11515TR]
MSRLEIAAAPMLPIIPFAPHPVYYGTPSDINDALAFLGMVQKVDAPQVYLCPILRRRLDRQPPISAVSGFYRDATVPVIDCRLTGSIEVLA